MQLTGLSGKWLEDLPDHEKLDVLAMIGEVFEIEEIDAHGHPWVQKSWHDKERKYHSHFIALKPQEMELIDAATK